MSIPQLSDKDLEDFFATRPDPLFESFFDSNFSLDFGQLPSSFESSDSSASVETQFFDGLSTVSSSTSFGVTDISPSSAFDLVLRPAHASHKGDPPSQPTNGAPRSRKLVHQLRPDGPGISGSELLSIEGQAQPMSIVASGHCDPYEMAQYPLPSTPPITPNPQRVRPRTSTSPIRKHRVASKRSKSHSAKAAAAAAAAAASVPEVPSIPYGTIRMQGQTMLQTARRATPLDIPHRPAKLPPSPPSSSRFPQYDHDSTSSMSSNYVGAMSGAMSSAMSSATSVQSTPAFQNSGIGSANYGAHTANAFAPTAGEDMAVLSSPWPTTQSQTDDDYSMYPCWDSDATPVFNSATALYDMPAFSATEPNNPYLFDASLASSGLMIQYGGNEGYPTQVVSTSFDYPTQYITHPPSSGPAPSMSPSMPLHPENRTAEKEPPPITLPKRGSASSASKTRRTTTNHAREPSRPNHAGTKISSSPSTSSTVRPRTAQHNASYSTGSISAPNTAGSIRSHKSTGSLASAAGAKGAGAKGSGGKGQGAKGSDKANDAVSSGTMGFVNFTAHDSRKILTGVAPSGSSKTKARREREAVERRRRLSEAAAKAVREAGGDLEGLMRVGVLEEDNWNWDDGNGNQI